MTASTIWPAQVKRESCLVSAEDVRAYRRAPLSSSSSQRVLSLVSEALKGKVLVFQQPQWRPQRETLFEIRDEWLARAIKLGMDMVGPVSIQKC